MENCTQEVLDCLKSLGLSVNNDEDSLTIGPATITGTAAGFLRGRGLTALAALALAEPTPIGEITLVAALAQAANWGSSGFVWTGDRLSSTSFTL